MRAPYVDRLEVRSYFCIQSVSVPLTPLHAFIGPNDSGKSTLLRAMSAVAPQRRFAFEELARPKQATVVARIGQLLKVAVFRDHSPTVTTGGQQLQPADAARLAKATDLAQFVRLDPDALRAPSTLIPSAHPIAFVSSRGAGLASVLDAVAGRDVDAWIRIRDRFHQLFPTVKRLEIRNADIATKTLGATLQDGTNVDAGAMSEGMLYWLAFAAMAEAERPSIYLVEEPENGLHPARIREVVALLRTISETAQVLIATHSPLVINELQPDEVSIVTRDPKTGTQVTPMRQTKNFAERSKVYALGELWLSYADGDLEAELTGPDDESKASA